MTADRIIQRRVIQRLLATGGIAALLIAATALTAAHAETGSKKSARHAQPSRPTQTAPDPTGSVGKSHGEPQRPPASTPASASAKASPGMPASATEDESVPVPYYLPNAPRARMHACGETWRAKKMSGDTGDDDWRDFATKCLVAKDSPPTN